MVVTVGRGLAAAASACCHMQNFVSTLSQLHTLTAAANHSQAVVPLLYVITLAVLVLLPAGHLVLKPCCKDRSIGFRGT